MTKIASPTRTQRKAEATRLAIIQIAEALILESGAAALTLEVVAERADVAVQTIYNRIGGRSALLMAVAERVFEENKTYMDVAYATAGTPLERLQIAAQGYFRFAFERPNEFRLLADPPNEPEALARVSELVRHQNSKMEAAIRDGISDGSIDPTIDPYLATTSMWAAANGILSLAWRADATPISPEVMEQLLAQWMAITMKGLTSHRS
ncbi:TetR/AcrR family transcriptional regulator [Pseudomonas fluorescens]|uniref:TetR/AcrR family transcriptional regulator n=1 Tax=Pseudomonas fluorescens TaxID=294 RepID=A0A327N9G8_PSEFL|nr:TetR/AcrR family transcriptional regulator [Pseudomonas fluorescens]RAI70854.1 TetR/AcrR family transcriptional regulator [Pseudomonas fluorescens]